ncbi:glucuronate isomerase [Arenibacter sp. F26102]|uniref:glucuronate isomerase n=1 Tax=Arenibacter sp. F26102 TaxID=2926416 RepID=UPI001FF3ADDC|nr:glucuronate isomerase [Arenibacter sp. F26102]MCK0146148.1 glucuronate isomerase [Arenibacter sp. F26102]
MKTFINDDFLLQSDFAKTLYHNYAKELPIIDYHNHLPPQEIDNNRVFGNISQAWLAGDHYKWRAMRAFGINERYITGDATDKEKFLKWAETVPYTVRNPLYHWTHLELQRYFGIQELLGPDNAEEIYEKASAMLQQPSHNTIGLLQQQKVESLCTTDESIDSLQFHKSIKKKGITPKVFPTFRPDKTFAIEQGASYVAYMEKLGEASNINITTFNDLLAALENRINYFHEQGGRLADHGLEQLYHFKEGTYDAGSLFKKVMDGKALTVDEVQYFKAQVLLFLGRTYHKKGWVQQFHIGAIRDNNKRLLSKLGPDTGFDSIGDYSQASALSGFLNELDGTDQLAKTIIYNLNPSDNEVIATMVGNFNDGSVRGKVQFGSGWWFLDQKDGMEKQMNVLSNMGLLSCFVGMLTDSRSFLSFPRHEYFRRILCNLIGKDVVNGELPADEKLLGRIVSDISYYNAKNFFDFNK